MRKQSASLRHLDHAETQRHIVEAGFRSSRANAFAFRDQMRNVVYDWHEHDHHQLLYAISGTLRFESKSAQFLLPPHSAVWVPAGVSHRTWLDASVEGASVCFGSTMVREPGTTIRVITASPLMREMILHALRWSPSRSADDNVADVFFQAMACLCEEWLKKEMPFSIPRSDHPALKRAADYVRSYISNATITGAARAALVSERTLRRMFEQELHCTWRQYLHQCRMVEAIALLGRPGTKPAEVCDAVGFESQSAFIKAFKTFSGETPSEFQRRARSPYAASMGAGGHKAIEIDLP